MWIGPKDHRLVGRQLTAARKAAGVSQDELADRLRKPQSFISAYERGERRVDVLEFLLILDALGAKPEALFAAIANEAEALLKERSRKAAQQRHGKK